MNFNRSFIIAMAASMVCSSKPLQAQQAATGKMFLNKQEYLEYQGVNVMLAHDFYPEGHQGGVGIIQNGQRVATNGDLRLEPTPGQWSPIPKVGKRVVDWQRQEVSVHMAFPDSAINRKGFNPVIYPDLHFGYTIRVRPEGKAFRITVDLDEPLPADWIGKVGFNLELFPGSLFGKTWYMDDHSGIFPQQAYDQVYRDRDGELQVMPMATGRRLVIAPESGDQRMTIENIKGDKLQLLDGRGKHTNGWYVVRSLVPAGATRQAIEWLVSPHAVEGWKSDPVVQVSQVGYHPAQQKVAVIELDAKDARRLPVRLMRISENGGMEAVLSSPGKDWGDFLRYHYLQFDFSLVKAPGMYLVAYGPYKSEPFKIGEDVYRQDVWQPTLEYFLPVQMCHMRVNDKYRVWHGFCHMDDARMAPIDSNHFDGYIQGPSTLTNFHPGDHVPLLDRGAWHDAGDFDLRVESQAETVLGLTLAYEQFNVQYDNTSIDQATHVVEIQRPDGKPDMLQQIEHGLLSIVGGYRSMGRFYRGIIEPTLRQYTVLGDPANITDNQPYVAARAGNDPPPVGLPGSADDRWVFTEDNPRRSLETAAALAAASRVMKGYNDTLAQQCLDIARSVWEGTRERDSMQRIPLAVDLLVTTGERRYADFLIAHADGIAASIQRFGWVVARTMPLISDAHYRQVITGAVKGLYSRIRTEGLKTPYGVPYRPNIWGAGWDIQHFGYTQYFLNRYFPEIVGNEYMLDAINFVLGCHPGSNTSSFTSGVGARSMTTAYGFNRADWSYIPGGVTSGTALIRPDFPELMKWPFFWQQGEYVLGGGTTDYLFLILAADHMLSAGDASPAAPPRPVTALAPAASKPADSTKRRIAEEMEHSLRKELLDIWYPKAVDEKDGGFLSSFSYDFKPVGSQDKMIVTQARHVWVNAKASERYPALAYYKTSARHGFEFLREFMWDKEFGGFYTLVDKTGQVKKGGFAPKEAYGNAFGIYALSAYYHASGDTAALNLAKKAFYWLERHSHDPVNKGYFQHMQRDGTPIRRTADVPSTAETGYKDQNSSIHLLEAFTELYSVWKDDLLRERLREMVWLLRHKIVNKKGNLTLFFQPDWTPVSFRDSSREVIMRHRGLDHASFGHDVETAYLLLEASRALGNEDHDEILILGKKMVDDALQNGWDSVAGGFYDEGYYFKGDDHISITLNSKNWWAQAEGLNSLLLMSDKFPNDPMHYFDKFLLQWNYIQTWLIDHEHGDWYDEGLDKSPQRSKALKGQIWKATYHNYRALVNCIDRLRGKE
ncbi:MAG: AGE family epimerase/isomerase [Bacteroidota bacterium]|nr:AGE family epimerase/isomerase [Bacteroidota bacterium]